jgi:hypothetical protein
MKLRWIVDGDERLSTGELHPRFERGPMDYRVCEDSQMMELLHCPAYGPLFCIHLRSS